MRATLSAPCSASISATRSAVMARMAIGTRSHAPVRRSRTAPATVVTSSRSPPSSTKWPFWVNAAIAPNRAPGVRSPIPVRYRGNRQAPQQAGLARRRRNQCGQESTECLQTHYVAEYHRHQRTKRQHEQYLQQVLRDADALEMRIQVGDVQRRFAQGICASRCCTNCLVVLNMYWKFTLAVCLNSAISP